nr:dicarboxylate transporter/tellurite-resistance protein TehA [Paraburkholderia sp. Ac-20340]
MFSAVLGLSGLGQSWRVAHRLWHTPSIIGESILLLAALVWLGLLIGYVAQAMRDPARTIDEFNHPISGGTPALIGIATLLMCLAVLPWSRALAWTLTVTGLAWHLAFSVWHTAGLWQGGRQPRDAAPTLYLPTVAGNLAGAAALGSLGQPSWAWLFFGAGLFSWLALEPLVVRRLWHGEPLPAAQRTLLGIQFAPPVVCATALLIIAPDTPSPWLLMLLGYSFFQMLVGLRLRAWVTSHPFTHAWWAFSFGVVSATLTCVKLAAGGTPAAQTLALPVFGGANLLIGYLCVRSLVTDKHKLRMLF